MSEGDSDDAPRQRSDADTANKENPQGEIQIEGEDIREEGEIEEEEEDESSTEEEADESNSEHAEQDVQAAPARHESSMPNNTAAESKGSGVPQRQGSSHRGRGRDTANTNYAIFVAVMMISALERTKLQLPEEYAKRLMVLTCDSKAEGRSCDVYLIGTAHVSEVVFVELCASRLSVLTPQIASKLDVLPGDEFRVAYEETVKYGSHVIVQCS
ncbi:hypothetical protein Bca52824_001765 [Brassica carinata]|uniref:Uncharacterized protein n=1 Tax=Brassica carinata TaxID=52824 RepID=A0A8X7WKT4_BRACI|nr:hypothetical protein Bca52824_001765 [Brassica carinata]